MVLVFLAIVMVILEVATRLLEFVSIASTILLATIANCVVWDFMAMRPKEDLIHVCHVLVHMLLKQTTLQQVVRLVLNLIST